MADRIKGITVEIGGDTTGLSKSLEGVNKKISGTKKDLREVERLLKLDPTNTQLLEQKQRMLNDTVTDTSKKLEQLQAAEKRVQQQMAEGKASQEQYDALQREILLTENQLKKAEDAARGFNITLEKVSGTAGIIADKTKVLSAAAGGILVAGVKTAADFESNVSQLAATMGKTNDEVQDLAEFAKQMGSQTAFSASEAAQGLNILAMAGLDAEEQMATLPAVLDLAAAGALSLDQAAGYLTGTVKGFSDSMENADKYADLIAKGATLAATDVNALGTAMQTAAATAASYSQSAEGTELALLRLAEQGVTGSEAATALGRAMSDLYTPTDAAKKALEKLGITVYDVETGAARDFNTVVDEIRGALSGMSEEEKNATAATIFTTQGLRAFNKMGVSSAETVAYFKEELEGAAGSAGQQAATQLDNLQGKITLLKSALEGAAITIGETVVPAVMKIVGWVQSFFDWFNNLDAATQKIITALIAFTAALFPVSSLLSKLPMILGNIQKAVGLVGKAFSFLAANPLGIALIAITAIITALVTLYRKNEDFRNLVDHVWNSIKNTISKVAKAVSEFFTVKIPAAVNKAVEFVKSLPDKMLQIGSQIVEGLKNGIKNAWEGLKSFVKNKVNGLVDSVKKLLGIASPSKVFAEIGLWVMKGFAQGMNDGARYAEDTAQKITEAVEAKVEALNARLQEEGDKTAKAALQAQIQELESFKNEYTTALNELENKQQSMAEKLKGYGDLFTMTVAEEGNILEISDIQEDIDAIYAYSDALDDLKARGASKEFLDVVTGLNIDDATAYITQLLQRSDEDFNTYMDKWEEKQRLSEEIARKWYQGDLDAIHEEFINKIPDTLSELQDQLVVTGRRAADSIAQGILSGAFTVRNALASVLMGQDATGILTASPTMPRSAAAEVSANSANTAVVSAPSSPTVVNVQFSGSLAQLGRVLQPVISTETMRRGASLIGG